MEVAFAPIKKRTEKKELKREKKAHRKEIKRKNERWDDGTNVGGKLKNEVRATVEMDVCMGLKCFRTEDSVTHSTLPAALHAILKASKLKQEKKERDKKKSKRKSKKEHESENFQTLSFASDCHPS